MRKVRLLGIAPYSGISVLMQNVAAKRDDISIDVFVGDMENGEAIAKKYATDNYDIIVSRGGTAELLQTLSLLPVVDIPISVYDIFRSIRLADTSGKKYAVIGFPSITKNAIFLKDMLQSEMPIYTIHNIDEAHTTLAEIKSHGYEMIVCDVITSSLADQFQLSSILISSGTESISSAFDVAIQIVTQRLAISDDNALFSQIIERNPIPAVVYTQEGNLHYQSLVTALPENISNILKNKIPSVLEDSPQKFHYEYSGLLYAITGHKFSIKGTTMVTYYINMRKVPLVLSKNGIRYTNLDQAKSDFQNSFYGVTGICSSYLHTIEEYINSDFPIAIMGEPGTGKSILAKLLYSRSALSASPMSVIDCSALNEKSWNFLTDNHNSPLSDTHTTIYIKNIHALKEESFYELLHLLDDLKLYRRNLLIFTIDLTDDESTNQRSTELINKLHCLTLATTPLAERLFDIPNIVSLYINHLNIIYGRNIIGIEPAGLPLLQEFQWNYNYNQLIRIITELVLSSDTSVISANSVKVLLRKELASLPRSGSYIPAPTDRRTLDEINLDIIKQVLSEEGGNQSKAAKRLGISRSTLWRLLQKE